jgi:hypothetical protein
VTNQKWQVGPVKLVNGSDGFIHRFCEKRQRYIGEIFVGDAWHASEWTTEGRNWSGGDLPNLNLAPAPKKTVRVQRYVNVFDDGSMISWPTREDADRCKEGSRFACIEIDLEVEEGEGLSCR